MASKVNLRRAKKIKLLAMDVDGVLTAGDVIVLNSGEEVKFWSSKDRFALAMVRESGIPFHFAWITGRSSTSVSRSAKDLGVKHLVQKCHDKRGALRKIMSELNVAAEETAFIGDDLLDLPALSYAGFSACPSDAVPDIRKEVHYVSPLGGGKGAVRDILEFILKAQGKWKSIVERFYR